MNAVPHLAVEIAREADNLRSSPLTLAPAAITPAMPPILGSGHPMAQARTLTLAYTQRAASGLAGDAGPSPQKWGDRCVAVWQRLSEGPMGRMRHVGVTRLGALFLALLVFALSLATEGQPAGKIPRLCFLTFDPGTAQSNRFKPFFQGLRDLGYVEGQTITIDYLSADGQGERFSALAADCLRLKADIIVVTTTPAAQAAKNATRTIPIVLYPLGDPVATGLVASLARPGENVTGLTHMASALAAKRLELLKEAVPSISRVLVLSYLVDPIAAPQVKELESAPPPWE